MQILGARVIVSEPNADTRCPRRKDGRGRHHRPRQGELRERITALTGGRGADAIFCAVSIAGAVEQAVEAVAKGGRVMVYASIYPRTARIPRPQPVPSKEITLTGTVSQSKEDVLEAVRLISGGIVDMKPLISQLSVRPAARGAAGLTAAEPIAFW